MRCAPLGPVEVTAPVEGGGGAGGGGVGAVKEGAWGGGGAGARPEEAGGGGGGGGGAAGDAARKALRAACSANEGALCKPFDCRVGGEAGGSEGAELRVVGGGLGAKLPGGGGGGAGGRDKLAVGGGGGGAPEGFREAGGGIGGFLPMGGGGLGFVGKLGLECVALGVGRKPSFNAATLGGTGAAPGGSGGAPVGRSAALFGITGAEALGASGLEELLDAVSGSESYAPVLTPPDFRSLGIPPAKRPPSCGAASVAVAAALPPPPPRPAPPCP